LTTETFYGKRQGWKKIARGPCDGALLLCGDGALLGSAQMNRSIEYEAFN